MKARALVALVALATCRPAVDFAQGRPYTCDDDTQCGEGWRCGLNQQCHAIGTPGTYACRRDAADCEAGWVCGVDHFCIDPNDAGFNACLSDSDCFHSLRCDVDGRCIDPSADLLGPTDSPPGPLTVLGPLVAPDGVTASQVAWAIEPRTGDPQLDAQRSESLAVGTQNLVTAVTSIARDAGTPLRTLDAGAWSNVRQVAATNSSIFWTTDTDLYVMSTAGNPNSLVPTVVHNNANLPLGPDWDLRTAFVEGNGTKWGALALAVDGGSEFHLLSGPGGGVSRFGPGTTRSELLGYDPCLIAAASDGLWAMSVADGGWSRLSLPELNGGSCASGISLPMRVRGALPNLLAVAGETSPPNPDGNYSGTASVVALFDVGALRTSVNGPDGGPPACAASLTPNTCHDARVQKLLGVCPACNLTGETLLDFFPLVLEQGYGVQTDCVVGTAVHTYEVTQSLDGTCNLTRFFSSEPQFNQLLDPPFGGTNPFGLAKAGQHGELYAGDNLLDARPVFLDRAPGGLFRPKSSDGSDLPVHMFADQWVAEVTPQGLAVLNQKSPTPIVANVNGTQAQVLYADRRLATQKDNGLSVFATVSATDATFLPPYGARMTLRNDGKFEYVVRSFDTIYSGHAPANAVSSYPLRLQAVPSGGSPITSLVTWTARDADAGEVEGYALTPTGLFAVHEDLSDAWSVTPVPTPAGNRVGLFVEGTSGRLGYEDGTFYALPSRVRLAPGINGLHFSSFLHACSETWGLNEGGLWRVVPEDGGTGHWVNEPLVGVDPNNFFGEALVGGRLFSGAGVIYLFNAHGGAVSFTPQAGCAAPDAGM